MIACEPAPPPLAAKSSELGDCISVIIPIWRDSDGILPLLDRLRSFANIREVIVSSAEPAVGLREQIEQRDGMFLQIQAPNRGQQLNHGAQIATGDWLLFHHADSDLRPEHVRALAALNGSDVVGGAFYRKFDERHPHLRFLERVERWHSRAFGTLYGDQSIFVRREHFWRLGGFAPLPLMEDVDISRKLRRSGKIRLLDPPVRSCAKAQIARGAWRVTLRNLLFLLLFRCGIPAWQLHAWYYSLD